MIAVIQRVSESTLKISGEIKAHTGQGLLILLGITHDDIDEDTDWLCKKIVNMRIFSDSEGKMNLSVKEVDGEILLVSQFTLHASTKKGNRPSFIDAAKPDQAIPLYEGCIKSLEAELGKDIQTGQFGADMKISLINDGPVTIILDSKNRK